MEDSSLWLWLPSFFVFLILLVVFLPSSSVAGVLDAVVVEAASAFAAAPGFVR